MRLDGIYDDTCWFLYNSLDIMSSRRRLMYVGRTGLTQWSRANTASTVRAQSSQQPPLAREGDKTERIWSSEEFTELRLTLVALWALQGGLPWHTLHTDNTHGAFRVEHEYSILRVYSGYWIRRKGVTEVWGKVIQNYDEQMGRGGF